MQAQKLRPPAKFNNIGISIEGHHLSDDVFANVKCLLDSAQILPVVHRLDFRSSRNNQSDGKIACHCLFEVSS